MRSCRSPSDSSLSGVVTEQHSLGYFLFCPEPSPAISPACRQIVSVMTPLAHVQQVVVGAILGLVVEVGDGEHDAGAGDVVDRHTVPSAAAVVGCALVLDLEVRSPALPGTLAAVARA